MRSSKSMRYLTQRWARWSSYLMCGLLWACGQSTPSPNSLPRSAPAPAPASSLESLVEGPASAVVIAQPTTPISQVQEDPSPRPATLMRDEAILDRVLRIHPQESDAIAELMTSAIQRGDFPGAVIEIGRSDGPVFRQAFGRRAVLPQIEAMTPNTVFDLASVTKVVATTFAVMKLVEEGRVELDAPASRYLPAIAPHAYTVRQLLTHTAGLPAVNALRVYDENRTETLLRIFQTRPLSRPGQRRRYSDLGFILLGALVEQVSGDSLDAYMRANAFEPLGMSSTGFRPPQAWRGRIAPTEYAAARDGEMIRGVVNDPRAYRLQGIAGNAGLFSTVADLGRFARMLLGGGALNDVRVLANSTVASMLAPDVHGHGLGWRLGRRGLGGGAYGHGGYTGTAFWVDPSADMYVVFLSNRVHPEGQGQTRRVLQELLPLARQAAVRARERTTHVVLTGIDRLQREGFEALRGQRIALLTHRAGRTLSGARTLDVLARAPEVEVVRVFAPEHGFASNREGHVANAMDDRTGIPLISLFGRRRQPTPAMFEGVDRVVIDLQDVGVRFYTYASTMVKVMEAAANQGIPVTVLDRPNPRDGVHVLGPLAQAEQLTFVNHHTLPVLHGMTFGELAELLDDERALNVDLMVIPMLGWRRSMRWRDTGLTWFPPSPNLRTPDQVALYPLLGLLEGTNLSVGRGTDFPFEVLGAPFLNPDALIEALGALSGLEIEPVRFRPRSARYRRTRCNGVRFHVLDDDLLAPIQTAFRVADVLRSEFGVDWDHARFANALANRRIFEAWERGATWEVLQREWADDLESFGRRRARHLLYERAAVESFRMQPVGEEVAH